MKTPDEIRNLAEAAKTLTKELVNATINPDDRVLMGIILMPMLPALDDFMDALKAETQEMKASVKEDPLDKILRQIKSNETLS